jgi:hypothetical protein
MMFLSGACVLPHPSKIKRGGEDAHFIRNQVVGVFDGVSQWYNPEEDAGEFALPSL